MSRVSRKSELSPSITKGSNNIDLGKNSGIDLGKKSQPSATSGGIGITQEVTNVGGMSVSAGANIDITPLDFGINVNPSEGTVSIATGAEIPGGLLGISGGIEIDTNTGQIIGGSLGGEIGGLGINVSNSQKGGLGIEFTVQIPATPIELSLGFGFPPPKDPKLTPTTPTTPTISIPKEQPATKWLPPGVSIDNVRDCTLSISWKETHININPYGGTCASYVAGWEPRESTSNSGKFKYVSRTCEQKKRNVAGLWSMQTINTEDVYKIKEYYIIGIRNSQKQLN